MRVRKVLMSVLGVFLMLVLVAEIAAVLVLSEVFSLGVKPQAFFADVKTGVSKRFSPSLRRDMLASELIEQAREQFEMGDYRSARKIAERAVKATPDNGDLHAILANCIAMTESPEAAVDYLTALSDNLKGNIEVRRSLGAAYLRKGDGARSLEIYLALAEEYENDAIAQADAGWAVLQSKNDAEAAREFFAAARAIDGRLEAALIGLLAISTSRAEKKEMLNALIAAAPDNSNYPGQLGWMEYEDGEYDRARMYSRMAVQADSAAHYAYFNLALAELRLGRLQDSWRSYIGAAAGCVSAGETYPFAGAKDDIETLPGGVQSEFAARVLNLLNMLEDIASPGVAGFLDEEYYGKKAFDFSAPDLLTGETVSLSDFLGKLVFVDFWASWCGPCIEELPNVVKLQSELGGSEFQVVSVSLDDKNSGEELKNLIEQYGINYPVLYSGGGFEQEAAKNYGVEYIPNTWMISPDGTILYHDLRGDSPMKYAKAYIESPVSEISVPEIIANADIDGLTLETASGAGMAAVLEVKIFYGLEYDEGDGFIVEFHEIKPGENGELKATIPINRPQATLNIAIWAAEAPVAGLPEPARKSGVINLRDLRPPELGAAVSRIGIAS